MQTGTQILLERMKTNPEEFAEEGGLVGRWERIIRDANNYLPQEDREAIEAAYKQLQVDRFNERVLRTLTGENEETATLKYRPAMTLTSNGSLGLGSLGLGTGSERFTTGWSDARGAFGSAVVKAEGTEVDSFKLTTSLRGQL